MNLDITQDNLYLLLPSKMSRVAEMLSDDNGISIVDAIKRIYSDLWIILQAETLFKCRLIKGFERFKVLERKIDI